MRNGFRIATLIVVTLAVALGGGAADDGLTILTWPIGLVAGEVEIEVDLGPGSLPAELFLDGSGVCTVTAAAPKCTVDLGGDLHVHLLELIRREPDGSLSKAVRWLNRPGREADLGVQLAARPIGGQCGGRLRWSDPTGQDPAALTVNAAGDRWPVPVADRSFAYPCAAPGETQVVVASAVFADGRRAVTAVVTNDAGRQTGEAPAPVVLEVLSVTGDPCMSLVQSAGRGPRTAERQGFELVFVLDPGADYKALADLAAPSSGTSDSWQDASLAFTQADRLWFVAPDQDLGRVDGFALGRESWLGRFFEIGPRRPRGRFRLADAVATAGLVVGAAPNRRAVVLVLGSEAGAATGDFGVAQTRAYLAEIGVPLFVIRSGRSRGDGWPEGEQVSTTAELAVAFDSLRRSLDRQCVGWLPSDWAPVVRAELLPEGVVVAGRGVGTPKDVQEVWRRAAGPLESAPDVRPVTEEPVARDRVEVTAVSVLVRTRDEHRRPVTDLSAGDLAVTEDGRSVPVLAVEPLPQLRTEPGHPPALAVDNSADTLPTRKIVPVAVYVERQLAGSADMTPGLKALAERAEWLTSLGPVDIVVADRGVEPYLEGAKDAATVRNALEELAGLPSRDHAIERIRKNYVRYIREYPERGPAREGGEIESSTPDNILRLKTMTAARSSIFEEDALLRRVMARMNDWALGLPSMGPRLLFLVGTGFDEDPIDFYLYFLESKEPSLAAAARAEFLHYNQATRVHSVGRELAAAGWMVVPVAMRVAGSMRAAAEFGGGEKFQAFLTDSPSEGGYLRDVEFMLLDPLGSQQHLAEPSGGKVVMGGRGLDELISESSGWYRLTYQVDRAPDGALHEVAITTNRAGVEVESTAVVVSGTSEGRAGMRLRKLFDDSSQTGELAVRVEIGDPRVVDGDSVIADMTVIVDFAPIAPLFAEEGKRVLRFSVAVRGDAGGHSIHHQLATVVGAVGGMRYEVPIQWKKKEPSDVSVVVEDLGSSAWGGTVQRLRE